MAMIMRDSAPSARIISAKPGKLVAMNAVSSTCTGFSLAKAHDQRRHGDAVIHVGRDQAAARRAALAVHDQVVAFDLDVDAVDAQHRGGGGEPVGFLDAQFLQAAHARRAFGEGGGDREHRIFVDHGRRALGRHVDALERASPHAQIGDVLAAFAARVDRFDRRAHLAQRREQAGAQRVGHHAFEDDLGARHDQRRDQRKRGRGRIGRHHDRRRLELRLALQRDAAAMLADAARPRPRRRNA